MIKIAPSLLSANFTDIKGEIQNLRGADYLHCDIMDGIFVPNLTFGFKMIEDIKKITDIPLDVHLMINEPERYIERFAQAGSDIISVHVESTNHVHRAVKLIQSFNKIPAVVLNPATPLDTIKYVLDDVKMVLLMSVNPGYGGQAFIPVVLGKIKELKQMIGDRDIDIEIDGGVDFSNIKEITDAGANVIVAGSTVFNAENYSKAIEQLKKI